MSSPLFHEGRLRASSLPRLKSSWLYRNTVVQRLLRASPTAAHLLEDLYRLVLAKVMRPEAKASAADIEARLADFTDRFPEAFDRCGEAPVFLLAAGWRSGSTLLQRVLMSTGELMIWGEPFARSGVTQTLLSQLRAFTDEWPPPDYFIDHFGDDLESQWIANSYPPPERLIAAHRAFFTELLAAPARARGHARWGLKEVRLGGAHALYLKQLFPEARFVFLIRDPYAGFASFRHYIKSDFLAWPDLPVHSAADFGRLWRSLVSDFERVCPMVDGLWLRYEDYLADPALHRALCRHVGAELVPPGELRLIASAGQPGSGEGERRENRLLALERRGLRRELSEVAERFGYAG